MSDLKIKLKPLNNPSDQTQHEVDYLILGGGCAGLGLAVNLLNSELQNKKILILEARNEYKRDKTWCSWGVFQHEFQKTISRSWSNFEFKSSNQRLLLTSEQHPYQHINALDYYKYALSLIERADNVSLRMQAYADSIDATDQGVFVQTNIGTIRAKYVFDGRPPAPPDKKSLQERLGSYAIQYFLGLHIIVDEPIFDENTATIMDSDIVSDGAAFYYVLPFSPYDALIEPTFFLKNSHTITELTEERLKNYIDIYLRRHHYQGDYKIIYQETDALPMIDFMTFEKHPHPRIYRIGAAAGMLQPGTSYAFNNIQRYNQKLVQLLCREEFPNPPEIFSQLIKNIDKFALRKLAKIANPDEYLDSMIIPTWSNIPGDTYARFMHDCLNSDDLEILSHSPSFQLFM